MKSSKKLTPSVKPLLELVQIGPSDDDYKAVKDRHPGLKQHEALFGENSSIQNNFEDHTEIFFKEVKQQAKRVKANSFFISSKAKQSDFKNLLISSLKLKNNESLDDIFKKYHPHMGQPVQAVISASLVEAPYKVATRMREEDFGEDFYEWEFGTEKMPGEEKEHVYFEVTEKIKLVPSSSPHNKIHAVPIPGYTITRFRIKEDGCPQWLYTQFSNELLRKFFLSSSLPPQEMKETPEFLSAEDMRSFPSGKIREKFRYGWTQHAALEITKPKNPDIGFWGGLKCMSSYSASAYLPCF